MATIIDRLLEKVGYFRLGKKGYEQLWAMGKEAQLFNNTLSQEYGQSQLVYKSIKAITDNISQAQIRFYSVRGDEEIVGNPDLDRLFRTAPNPMMSFNELLEATVMFHRLAGEAFWLFTQSRGQVAGTSRMPSEIWTFNPSKFKEHVDRATGQLLGWKYGTTEYPIEQVLHVRDNNPYHDIRGLSPLRPGRMLIDIDWQSLIYNKAFFENDATPGFLLTSEQSLTKTQRDRIEAWLHTNFKGASNAFKSACLEAGVKPVKVSATGTEMQFIEQKKLSREEIIGIWRVPKAIIGYTEDLNFATYQGQKKIFWTDTLVPILNRMAEEINSQFFARFMPEAYCKFDFSAVPAMQEDMKDRLEAASKLWGMGVPFNVVNERFNLGVDDIPGGDIGYLPFSLMPAGPEGPVAPEPAALPAPEPKQEPKKDMLSAAATEKLWKGFLRLHEASERNINRAMKSYFYQQRIRVLASLHEKSAGPAETKLLEFIFDWGKESEVLKSKLRPLLEAAILQGVEYAAAMTTDKVDQAVLDGKLSSYLAMRVDNLTGVSTRIMNRVEGIIREGIQNGDSVTVLSDSVRGFYNDYSPMASLRIARTETTTAINGGTLQYFDAIGAKTKTWLTAGDEHVRESHRELQGQTVGINNKFKAEKSGATLAFPGDQDAGPEEVINCRCTIITRDTF